MQESILVALCFFDLFLFLPSFLLEVDSLFAIEGFLACMFLGVYNLFVDSFGIHLLCFFGMVVP